MQRSTIIRGWWSDRYTLIGHAGYGPRRTGYPLFGTVHDRQLNTAHALWVLTEDTVHVVSNEDEALLDVRVEGKPGERAVLLGAFDMACCSIRDNAQYDSYFSLKRGD